MTSSQPDSSRQPTRDSNRHSATTGGQQSSSSPSRLSTPRLDDFRSLETPAQREARLRGIWHQLPKPTRPDTADKQPRRIVGGLMPQLMPQLTPERAARLRSTYEEELMNSCNGNKLKEVTFPDFVKYTEAKEAELWSIFHDEMDLDGNGHLDATELRTALSKAGINLSPPTIGEFIAFLTSSPDSNTISFPEFRDFLLLMPRKASTAEIYRYYEVRKFMGDDGRGAVKIDMLGDVTASAEDKPPGSTAAARSVPGGKMIPHKEEERQEEEEPPEQDTNGMLAGKFLLAGGIAGAVSRTATAPFDRLKVFLITRPPDPGLSAAELATSKRGAKALLSAISKLYAEGGVKGFWVGNGLNLVKIFPESAIKFLSYEASKRAFAKYWDNVEDSRDIRGVSRFLSGGIGGTISQLSIYPIETLKTQMMSTTGDQTRAVLPTMKRLYAMGGIPAFYRGLGIGLIGVFPYAAIDMSTFEAMKLAYLRSTGKDEPGILAILAFGSVSGSVGATSVYPLNLVRTRLQASGSSGHPQRYTGIWDVTVQTYRADGWRGFYRGLFPTLAKVVPAVSISYVVYEDTKRRLGV